jgi:endoglucanase
MRGVRVTFATLLALRAAVSGAGAPGAPAQSSESNPLAGVRLYVDPDSPSWEQWQAYERSGQRDKADLIWKIAREPRAMWLGRFTRPNFHVKVRRLIDAAVADGSVQLFTVLRAQSTGCGGQLRRGRHGRGRALARLVRRPRPSDRQ